VGRAQEGGCRLTLEIEIIGEIALTGQQPDIFLAPDWLAYPELTHFLSALRRSIIDLIALSRMERPSQVCPQVALPVFLAAFRLYPRVEGTNLIFTADISVDISYDIDIHICRKIHLTDRRGRRPEG
jgi:hypothetical protein